MPNILDIIIPIYNTPEEYLVRALNSINKQKNVNFKEIGVIIVDDCSTKIKYKKSWFKQRFPKLHITYIVNDINVGPGLSRQKGIDNSDSVYVTFLDSDDEISGNDKLSMVLECMVNPNISTDRIVTSFLEEVLCEDGTIRVIKHGFDSIKCLHGLFLKKSFIDKYNIRFIDGLRSHEDVYMTNILNIMALNSTAYLDENTYIWKWNQNSLVRKNNYIFFNLKDYITAKCEALRFVQKHNINDKLFICMTIFNIYVLLASNLMDYEQYNIKKEEYEEKLSNLVLKNLELLLDLKDGEIEEFTKNAISSFTRVPIKFVIKESFNDFINRLEKTYGNN